MVEIGEKSLQRGQTIPDFTLDDFRGEPVSSRSFYLRRNYVIALLPDEADDHWNEWLTMLSAAARSIDERDVVCLLIFPVSWQEGIGDLYSNGDQVKLLIDHDGVVAEKFGREPSHGTLLIADRYGVVFHAATGEPSSPELDASEVPEWIELIACRCS